MLCESFLLAVAISKDGASCSLAEDGSILVVVERTTDSGAAEEPVLTGHAMEVVTALASAPVPEK